MAIHVINDGEDGLSVRNALNSMFTEIYGLFAGLPGFIPGLRDVYVSNVLSPDGTVAYGASDANDGLTPQTPKLTLTGARAVSGKRTRLWQSGGSKWHGENVDWTGCDGIEFLQYGQGPAPVWTCRLSAKALVWTRPNVALYPNVWTTTVVLPANPVQATAIVNNVSSIWQPAMYDENGTDGYKPIEGCGLARRFTGGTRAACLALVQANWGSFYTNVTGSATVNPLTNGEAGNSIDMYVSLADGSNPNGKEISYVDQRMVATIPPDVSITNLTCECTGSKDFMNVTYSPNSTPGKCRNLTMKECGIHGGVWSGVSFENCRFLAAYHDGPRAFGGGGIHNFRGTQQQGMSRGYTIRNCYVKGFNVGFYSHGAGVFPNPPAGDPGTWDHDFVEVINSVVEDCNFVQSISNPRKGTHLKGVRAYNCGSVGNVFTSLTLTDCKISLNDAASDAIFYDIGKRITLNNSFIYTPIDRWLIVGSSYVAGDLPAVFLTITLNDSAIIGSVIGDGGNVARHALNLVLTGTLQPVSGKLRGSYIGRLLGSPLWVGGTITANSVSVIECDRLTPEELIAAYPGISAGVITGVNNQISTRVLQAADITFANAFQDNTRWVTYAGVPLTGVSGAAGSTATFVLNAGITPTNMGRSIRVEDAYGAGLHYIGRVLHKQPTGTTITVTPSPTGAFAVAKFFRFGSFNRNIFGSSMSGVVAALALTGTAVRVSAGSGEFYSAGMKISVSNVPNSPGKTFSRTVQSVAGDIINFTKALPMAAYYAPQFKALDGTGAGIELPTCSIGFGYPFLQGAVSWRVVFGDALGDTGAIQQPNTNYGYLGTYVSAAVNVVTDRTTDGVAIGFHGQPYIVNYGAGIVSSGITLADTDTLTVTAKIEVEMERMSGNVSGDLINAGDLRFARDSVYADRLGYRAKEVV